VSSSDAIIVAASRLSVTPLIAETTTTGDASRCAATMRATFSKAAASATDVPPNFITSAIENRECSHKKAHREHKIKRKGTSFVFLYVPLCAFLWRSLTGLGSVGLTLCALALATPSL